MRLTLRTMLAYMDDILEPEDATDIGKKLEESDLAKTIMQRLRESIRRARLGAPAPLGHGMGTDPNSVAEYLDNTLPAEQVGEFERICLESDVHLAEVGACHQILTLVLGEPAEVDAAARERMYHLTAPPAAAPAPVVAPVAQRVVPAGPQPVVRRVKPEVPEYLRQSRSRHWGLLAAVLACVLVGGGIATAVFLPEMRKILGRSDAGNQFGGEQSGDEPVTDARPSQPTIRAPRQAVDSDDEAEPAEATAGANPPTGNNADNAPLESGDLTAGAPDELMPADEGAPEANPAALPDAGPAPAAPAEMPEAGGGAPPIEDASGGEVLGRYMNKQDVLLRLDRASGLWKRLPGSSGLSAGDQLVSLPSFRPTIGLVSGVTLQPADSGRFELLGLDAAGVPALRIDYGRLVLVTAGKARNPIRIVFGDHQALLTFVNGEATVAIDVRRLWIPGNDPTKAAAPVLIDLFVTTGSVSWEDGATTASWQAPLHARIDGNGVQVAGNEFPKWAVGAPLSKLARDAADAAEHELSSDRPTTLSVKELLGDRRREVRSLGVEIAANVDEFLPLVKMLNDADQRLVWPIEIETLRAAMVRNPETAELIGQAFTTSRPADGSELFRLLWGYSAEELAGGAMEQLVAYLDHDEMEFRVLAFYNLVDVTKKNLGYRPDDPAQTRRQKANEWKKRLKELKAAVGK